MAQQKMDPIAKEVWCQALRSGEFAQTTGMLKSNDSRYCCLGVAKEIFPALKQSCPTTELLSPESCSLLGITEPQQQNLAKLNDKGNSFKRIAGYIQRYL